MTRMDASDQPQFKTRTVGRLGFCSLGEGIGWSAVDGSVIGGAGNGSRPRIPRQATWEAAGRHWFDDKPAGLLPLLRSYKPL